MKVFSGLLILVCAFSAYSAPDLKQIICVTEHGESFTAKKKPWNAFQLSTILPQNGSHLLVVFQRYEAVTPGSLVGRKFASAVEVFGSPDAKNVVSFKGINIPKSGKFETRSTHEHFSFAVKDIADGKMLVDFRTSKQNLKFSCDFLEEYNRY